MSFGFGFPFLVHWYSEKNQPLNQFSPDNAFGWFSFLCGIGIQKIIFKLGSIVTNKALRVWIIFYGLMGFQFFSIKG